MESKEKKQRLLTKCLFAVYFILLTWIVLFKMQFSITDLDRFRSVNYIPFGQSVIVNNRIEFSEIFDNILVFVPFGLYISMLKGRWRFLTKAAAIAGVSLFYEAMQFLLAIGASDITDLIDNTLGGVVGIAVYIVLFRFFRKGVNKALNVIALFGTTLAVILLIFLAVMSFYR